MRSLVWDLVLGVVLGALSVGFARGQLAWRQVSRAGAGAGPPWDGGEPGWDAVESVSVVLPWGVWAGVVVLVVAVVVRRLSPRVGIVAAGVGVAAVLVAGPGPGPVMFMAALVVFSAALRMEPGLFVAWAGPVVVVSALVSQADRPWWGWADGSALAAVVFGVGAMAVPAGAGVFARSRRLGRERDRAEELARSRYEERLSIAREVHDVVGHSLSVISMQASVALHVVDRRPEQAPVALAAIRDASREALEELRGTLAVFRRPEEGAGRGPLPGLGRLEALVGSLVGAGRPVELVWRGEPVPVGPVVDVAAYRIVQEALTNVVRHAGGARAVVEVSYEVGRVRVRVVDEGPGGVAVEGMGIVGMRERAAAVGGTLRVGPGQEGGFEVCAVLPVGGER